HGTGTLAGGDGGLGQCHSPRVASLLVQHPCELNDGESALNCIAAVCLQASEQGTADDGFGLGQFPLLAQVGSKRQFRTRSDEDGSVLRQSVVLQQPQAT